MSRFKLPVFFLTAVFASSIALAEEPVDLDAITRIRD